MIPHRCEDRATLSVRTPVCQSLTWVNTNEKQTAAELRAARRHVQKKGNARISKLSVLAPCLRPSAGLRAWPTASAQQRADLAFFERRTMHDWSGWQDLSFWSLVLCISHECSAVAHALTAFAALHKGQRKLAFERHARSLIQPKTCFEGLVSCMLIICFQNLTGQRSFRLLKSGLAMLQETPDARVKPLYDLLKARPCMMPDLCAALDIAVAKRVPLVSRAIVIEPFATSRDARDCLSAILQHGIDLLALGKSLESVRELLHQWHDMLNAYDTVSAVRATNLLRAAALAGKVLLEHGSLDTFDEDFSKIIDYIEDADHTRMCFGIDGGLIDILCFVGTKCRGPARYRALHLLKDRVEGDRVAKLPAAILALQIKLEEGSGEQLRLLEGRQRHGKIELSFEGEHGLQEHEIEVPLQSTSLLPDTIYRPGYAAYLDGDQYWRLELEDFHFPISRV